jgi:surface protein
MSVSPTALNENSSAITNCTTSPALPAWATINPLTCVISGTPTALLASTSYTITATNSAGSTDATVSLVVPIAPFITQWITTQTSGGSSDVDQIRLPTVSGESYNFIVDWGDDSQSEITSWNDPDITHTYTSPGTYTLKMWGNISSFENSFSTDRLKMIDVLAWGNNAWTSMRSMFALNSNITQFSATDAPNLSLVTNMSSMFSGAEAFNDDLSNWDTSSVTNMSSMFEFAQYFNGNISTWDTSNVTDMYGMFALAHTFNGDLSSWDTSNVINIASMFSEAYAFNRDISSWDTSRVEDMSQMFKQAYSFNGDLSSWDTSNVTDMSQMFNNALAFNDDLSSWDTSSVTDMSSMFFEAIGFNGDISSWDTSNVSDMSSMFIYASAFNGNISSWDTSNVTNMSSMFQSAASFNQDLSGWDVDNVSYSNDFSTDATSWVLPQPSF